MKVPKGYIIIKEEEFLQLHQQIMDMQFQIEELTRRMNKNSTNSHKPPSTDNFKKKIQNNREKSNKKPGAQEGHEGKTLIMTEKPDKILEQKVTGYCTCGKNLNNQPTINIQRRQVIELVEKLTEVIEYKIEVKQCKCGKIHRGEANRLIPIQYGNKLKAMMVYLNQYEFIPYERLQEYFKDCIGINISDGVLQRANQKCFENLETTEQQIKERIINSYVIHNDETGLRSEEKTKWVHTHSTEKFTFYSIHEKRGRDAINDIGILNGYKGVSVHDRYSSYDDYNCKHAYCNAHLLRDLKGLYEEESKKWAKKMIAFLVKAKREKNKEEEIKTDRQKELLNEYKKILHAGYQQEPKEIPQYIKKRGRKKKPKSLKLLDVFRIKAKEILRFLIDAQVPFDNNLAERDLRMVKLKQKISGCFRTKSGGQIFCRIRSYISTIRKQNFNVLENLKMALDGCPINFSC